MKIFETTDGMGGWVGTYKVGRFNAIAWRFHGNIKWVPVKKFLFWWVRDRSKSTFFDNPSMFREKEMK